MAALTRWRCVEQLLPRFIPACTVRTLASTSRHPFESPHRSASSDPPPTASSSTSTEQQQPEVPHWRLHREAMRRLYPDGWDPPLKLSRPAMSLVRSLHEQDPVTFSTDRLAMRFKVSPEAVRRILRGKWKMEEDKQRELEEKEEEGEKSEERKQRRREERAASRRSVRDRSDGDGTSYISMRRSNVGREATLGAAVVEPPPRRLRPSRAARPRPEL